jgi:beta-lactamase superfamily II metal-dependent hydrolase
MNVCRWLATLSLMSASFVSCQPVQELPLAADRAAQPRPAPTPSPPWGPAAPDTTIAAGTTVEVRAAATTPVQRRGDPADDQCLVDFLDVGTGLAVFIRCKPAGGSVIRILFDGGTVDGVLNRQGRLKYLLETGLRFMAGSTIDHLFQSHPHYDHHSDLIRNNGILQNYDVRHVWDPAAPQTTSAYACFLKDIVNKANTSGLIYHPARRCPARPATQCDRTPVPWFTNVAMSVRPFDAPSRGTPMTAPFAVPLGAPGLSATIFHADPDVNVRDDANDASIVVKLDLFGVKLLLTGDEEAGRHATSNRPPTARSVEKFLLDGGFDLSANIVQVPHHGSESSSSDDFQNATIITRAGRKETYAVISSGPKVWNRARGTTLPTQHIVQSWQRKLGRGRVVSTRLNDLVAPRCELNPSKIAPDPATDRSSAGCNNIQFVISARARGRKITASTYWPMGGRIP